MPTRELEYSPMYIKNLFFFFSSFFFNVVCIMRETMWPGRCKIKRIKKERRKNKKKRGERIKKKNSKRKKRRKHEVRTDVSAGKPFFFFLPKVSPSSISDKKKINNFLFFLFNTFSRWCAQGWFCMEMLVHIGVSSKKY